MQAPNPSLLAILRYTFSFLGSNATKAANGSVKTLEEDWGCAAAR